MQGASTWLSLYDAIKSYEKLGVDDYQRTYSWAEEQIDEFLKTFVTALRIQRRITSLAH